MSQSSEKTIQIAVVVVEAIRELGSVPNGHLYAHVMGMLSFDEYQRIIAILKESGLVKEENHLLTYVGPKEKP
jgi:hypothetical protein